jgi:hypothetical protein
VKRSAAPAASIPCADARATTRSKEDTSQALMRNRSTRAAICGARSASLAYRVQAAVRETATTPTTDSSWGPTRIGVEALGCGDGVDI